MARTKAEAIRRAKLRQLQQHTAPPIALRKYSQNAPIPYPHTIPPKPPRSPPPRPLRAKKKVYPTIAQLYNRAIPPKKMKIADFVKGRKAKRTRKGKCARKSKVWTPVKGHERRVNECVTFK